MRAIEPSPCRRSLDISLRLPLSRRLIDARTHLEYSSPPPYSCLSAMFARARDETRAVVHRGPPSRAPTRARASRRARAVSSRARDRGARRARGRGRAFDRHRVRVRARASGEATCDDDETTSERVIDREMAHWRVARLAFVLIEREKSSTSRARGGPVGAVGDDGVVGAGDDDG